MHRSVVQSSVCGLELPTQVDGCGIKNKATHWKCVHVCIDSLFFYLKAADPYLEWLHVHMNEVLRLAV